MPPALEDTIGSDSSDDGQDSVPARKSLNSPKKAEIEVKDSKEEEDEKEEEATTQDPKEEVDDSDDDEGGEDEYVVEKILRHDFDEDGNTIYLIKWLGYERASDRTWEPEEHLQTASELLNLYHESIGGPPHFTPPPKKNAKGSKRAADADADDTTPNKKQRGRKAHGIEATGGENGLTVPKDLPLGSWESDVVRVASLVKDVVRLKNGKSEDRLVGHLEWRKPGVGKTQHPLRTLRQKCPQKLLDYYEMHLKFT